jgi:hypothetical protein
MYYNDNKKCRYSIILFNYKHFNLQNLEKNPAMVEAWCSLNDISPNGQPFDKTNN